MRNLFVPRLQSGKRKSKNRWFLAAFLHPFAAVGKRMSRRSAKYSRRRQKCRTRVQPAIEERKTGRRGRRPLRRDRRECAGIQRCADAGRRGRRPLRGARTGPRRNDPRPGRGTPFLHLTTKAQKIATQGQLFPPRVIAFGHAASKRTLTGCLPSAFVCVILGNDSTYRNLWNRQAFYNRS